MLPSLVVDEVRHGVAETLRVQFEPSTELFKDAVRRLIEDPSWVKGPYVQLGMPFLSGTAGKRFFKALPRRFANAWSNEYDTLRPVADLVARLQENISRWLDSPAGWTRPPENDEERNAALAAIRKAVFTALHDLAEARLLDRHRPDWRNAFDFSGSGSSYRRAEEIEHIYEEAAPPISSAMSEPARVFLHSLHQLVRTAVEGADGRFQQQSGSESAYGAAQTAAG
ncbi:MAG: hypothetical protein K9M02_20665 [Thiohalocapsa sp.]|nr:hypothetical protein [Thiohalocapsa sp.]